MKSKTAALIMALVITATLLYGNMAYAAVTELKTRHTIHVTIIIPSKISLDLEDEWVKENLHKPEAEAFAELKDEGILVDKIKRGDSTLWLFTKTE